MVIMVLYCFFDFESFWLSRIRRSELNLKWTSYVTRIVSVEEFILGAHPGQLESPTFISAVGIR